MYSSNMGATAIANSSNIHDDIEWMRINAERERIALYREVAKESA
jgi:hypothetical protein